MSLTRRRLLVLAAVAVVVAVGGLMVTTRQAPPVGAPIAVPALAAPDTQDASPSGAALDAAAAATPEEAVPLPAETIPEVAIAIGADRTEQGARDAAVAILELTEQAVTMSPADAAAFQRPFSTASFAGEAAATTEAQMVELHRTIPDGVTLRLAPIAVRSDADGDGWVVSIWFVEAITIGTEAVVDDWRTATYRMRWEDNAWKVAAFESVRGPMPGRGTQPASAPPLQFEALLTGYTDDGLN